MVTADVSAESCTCGPGVWGTCDYCGTEAWVNHRALRAVLDLAELATLWHQLDAAPSLAGREPGTGHGGTLPSQRAPGSLEVVSMRDLYERVAQLRGELAPVVFDFPPVDCAGDIDRDGDAR